MARSGSATSPPAPVIWSPWTPSLSASPEGIGPVWQLTAVDPATRYGIGTLVAGDKSARDAAGFVDHVAERLAGIGAELTGVLTDNGPEFTGRGFTSHLKDLGIDHHRIPPRSPNHNAVCERFQGTALQEFYRPAFHRQHFTRWLTSTPSSRVGSRPTTLAAATTATSCAAARPLRSWRPTYHDQAQGSPVTSTRAQEALA
jgi:transposase InsO family protein